MYVDKTERVMQIKLRIGMLTKLREVCCYVDKTKKGMLTKLRE